MFNSQLRPIVTDKKSEMLQPKLSEKAFCLRKVEMNIIKVLLLYLIFLAHCTHAKYVMIEYGVADATHGEFNCSMTPYVSGIFIFLLR